MTDYTEAHRAEAIWVEWYHGRGKQVATHYGKCSCGVPFTTREGILALCHLLRGHARVMA